MPKVTVRDVAKHAGLSTSTVNRAIHEPEKVKPETLRAVLEAADASGFYGRASIKQNLPVARPKLRVGILLLQKKRVLYQNLAKHFEDAARNTASHEVVLQIGHLDELSPQNVSDAMKAMAAHCDTIGVVSIEHPIVAQTIEMLAQRGVKTFAIVSPLTARCNVGYVGIDHWKEGRCAGWAMHNICRLDGKVAVLVGNHRYRCQELAESGFRSYFREHVNGFEILDAQMTFETSSIAQQVVEQLLENVPDLVGIYVAGGGVSGVCAALRESGRAKDIVVVGHDLTEVTATALLDGTINFLISQPLAQMTRMTIEAMARSFEGGPDFPPQSISLPFDVFTPENL